MVMKRYLLLLVLAGCTNLPTPISQSPASPDENTAYLTAINAARAEARVCGEKSFVATTTLTWNDKLEAAAKTHSDDMRDRDYFAHKHPTGPTLAERLKIAGYVWSSYGENIAAGYPNLEAVMTGWLKSPGHCSNIMNPNFTEVGLVLSKGGSYRTYWTMNLGKPKQ